MECPPFPFSVSRFPVLILLVHFGFHVPVTFVWFEVALTPADSFDVDSFVTRTVYKSINDERRSNDQLFIKQTGRGLRQIGWNWRDWAFLRSAFLSFFFLSLFETSTYPSVLSNNGWTDPLFSNVSRFLPNAKISLIFRHAFFVLVVLSFLCSLKTRLKMTSVTHQCLCFQVEE